MNCTQPICFPKHWLCYDLVIRAASMSFAMSINSEWMGTPKLGRVSRKLLDKNTMNITESAHFFNITKSTPFFCSNWASDRRKSGCTLAKGTFVYWRFSPAARWLKIHTQFSPYKRKSPSMSLASNSSACRSTPNCWCNMISPGKQTRVLLAVYFYFWLFAKATSSTKSRPWPKCFRLLTWGWRDLGAKSITLIRMAKTSTHTQLTVIYLLIEKIWKLILKCHKRGNSWDCEPNSTPKWFEIGLVPEPNVEKGGWVVEYHWG